MKNKLTGSLVFAMLISTLVLSACSTKATQDPDNTSSPSVTEGTGTPENADAVSEITTSLGYVKEMDKTAIMTVAISVSSDEWQAMLDNAEAEEYIPADITINGTTIKNVGIRPKGNSSLSSIARNNETNRYSFKIKFDEYVSGQTWLGLDKLVLNNNYSDSTSMKEYLSYDIMSYIGVDAPLYAYADISVNGVNWGFYLAVEDVDSGYLERAKNDEGELYKPESMEMNVRVQNQPGDTQFDNNIDSGMITPETSGIFGNFTSPDNAERTRPDNLEQREGAMGMRGSDNGVSLVYTDDNISSYSAIFDNAETKTNESDNQRVIEALKNLNNGTELEKYVDVDAVLRYLAAHTIVVNLDSYSSSMGHNYYLYENDGQISILPWDYNMAFGGFQSGNASSVVNFPIDTPVSGVSMDNRPLISKLLEVPEYLEKYHQYLQEIIDGYFSDGKFEQTVNKINGMISNYIQNDPSAFFSYEKYQEAIVELKELGTLRAESVQGQLDGTIPSTNEGQSAVPDKLVDASSVNMSALGDSGMGGRAEDGGFGGIMPNMPNGFNMENIQKAMEIIKTATDSKLTDDQLNQLYELGFNDEQIEQMLTTPSNIRF